MTQGIRIPLSMADNTRAAIDSARNGVRKLSMDAQKASASISRAGGVIGQTGGALGSAAGGRLGQIGGAIGGVLSLGPIGLAIGGLTAGISAITSSFESAKLAVDDHISGVKAMTDANKRAAEAVRGRQRGSSQLVNIMAQAESYGLRSSDLQAEAQQRRLAVSDVATARIAGAQGEMTKAQVDVALSAASTGIVSMADALKAAKSLGRGATIDQVLVRASGQQMTSANLDIMKQRRERMRGFTSAIYTQRNMQGRTALASSQQAMDIENLATEQVLAEDFRNAQDPVAAERQKALKELRDAYNEAWSAHVKLEERAGFFAKTANVFGMGPLSETASTMNRASAQYHAAQGVE